jgi:hypothetical protein
MVKATIAKKELITDETRGNIQYNVFHIQVSPRWRVVDFKADGHKMLVLDTDDARV